MFKLPSMGNPLQSLAKGRHDDARLLHGGDKLSDKGYFAALATILFAWLEIGKLFCHWFLFAFHFYQQLVLKHQRSQWTECALIGPQFPAFVVAGRERLP